MSLHLNLQCQRADKNTDTRITSLAEDLEHLVFCDHRVQAVEAVRCGDTPLGGVPIRVKHYLSYLWQFSRVGAFMTPHAPRPGADEALVTAPHSAVGPPPKDVRASCDTRHPSLGSRLKRL